MFTNGLPITGLWSKSIQCSSIPPSKPCLLESSTIGWGGLAAGAVLHATYDQQDQRRLGGIKRILPSTYTAIRLGNLSLMALPWKTGFYSQDLILEVAYGQYEFSGQVAYWLGTIR